MNRDPIVEETRQRRDEYASQFRYDLKAIYRDLKEKEARHRGRFLVDSSDPRIESHHTP